MLVDQSLVTEFKRLDDADDLANLSEATQTLENLIHPVEVVQLVEVKLELLRQVASEAIEGL